MVTPRTRTRRATTWLCLAVALLVALMPVAGVMVCLGQDGHVGFGAATDAGSCPCTDASGVGAEPATALANNEARHPPCYDIALDLPVVLEDAGSAQKPAHPADTLPSEHRPAVAVGIFGEWGLDKRGRLHRPGGAPPDAPPSPQLEHRRAVVLLI